MDNAMATGRNTMSEERPCNCGQPAHPNYNGRCENCYADGSESAVGHRSDDGLLQVGSIVEYPGVRCFATNIKGKKANSRRGVWIMTRPTGPRGMFFHGDRCEIQPPDWTVEQLIAMSAGENNLFVEISPRDVLAELDKGWPEAKQQAYLIFARHGVLIYTS